MRLITAVIAIAFGVAVPARAQEFTEFRPPAWVQGVTRMAFGTPGEVDKIADAGAQVLHTNLVWPYFPLRRDGGGLSAADRAKLRGLVADPPHRAALQGDPRPAAVHAGRPGQEASGLAHRAEERHRLKPPTDKDLGTRSGCNNGPWGDYLIDVCAELIEDFSLDGFSFDGNYHPPLCHCPACQASYQADWQDAPAAQPIFDEVAYRQYLVWRGERLEDHYRKLIGRMRKANPDAAPDDLDGERRPLRPFPAFAAGHADAPQSADRPADAGVVAGRDEPRRQRRAGIRCGLSRAVSPAQTGPCASEPYLMSRGNPYGTDSFPAHERRDAQPASP